MAFHGSKPDLKEAQISAIISIHDASVALSNNFCTFKNEPHIQQDHRQGQPGQAAEGVQVAVFQIEPLPFQIPVHFFDPHAPLVGLQGLRLSG